MKYGKILKSLMIKSYHYIDYNYLRKKCMIKILYPF